MGRRPLPRGLHPRLERNGIHAGPSECAPDLIFCLHEASSMSLHVWRAQDAAWGDRGLPLRSQVQRRSA
eukprot:2659734-Heterocapsa_arctica.AAC.1